MNLLNMGPYNPSLTLQIISIILGLLNTCAGISIIVTILKYKRLKTRANFFIINIIIASVLLQITIAILSQMNNIRHSLRNNDVTVYNNCNFLRIFNFLLMLQCSFANMLALDWYLTTFKPLLATKFERIYKYVIVAIFVVNTVGYAMSFLKSCEGFPMMVYVAYFMSVLQTFIFNLLSCFREYPRAEPRYSLLVSSLAIYFCLPYFVCDVYVTHLHSSYHSYFTLWVVHVGHLIAQWPVYYVPVATALVLIKRDALFKVAFNKVVKRRAITKEQEDELQCCAKMDVVYDLNGSSA